jgi:glycosyltransferase involved in cell wall biosynthesis
MTPACRQVLWLLPGPFSRKWSFSYQIRLVSRTFTKKGLRVIFSPGDVSLKEINAIIKKRPVAFIMPHGYPDMFPFLFEEGCLSSPVYFWAQVSGTGLAKSFKGIKIKETCFIPITPLSKHFLEEAGCLKVTEVIPHMIDLEAFHPLSRKERQKIKASVGLKDKFVFGKVAVNSTRKRLKDLITIYAELKNKLKSGALVLKTKRVSSEGEDLGVLVKKLALEKEVFFVEDELSPGRLNQFYNSLDLYCHLSEWEGFGLAVAEAMAAGLPVLAHATQGPGEYIPCREFLVPSAQKEKVGGTEVGLVDREEFKKKMLQAYEEPEVWQRLAEKGYDYVRQNFSPSLIADKFLRLTCKIN